MLKRFVPKLFFLRSHSRTFTSKYDQDNKSFAHLIASLPQVQNLLKKFEAFASDPTDASLYPLERVRNHRSEEVVKCLIPPESLFSTGTGVTEKAVRLARRINYKTYIQNGIQNLDDTVKQDPQALREASIRISREAAESWRMMSQRERFNLVRTMNQSETAKPNLSSPVLTETDRSRSKHRKLLKAQNIREASRLLWDREYRWNLRLERYRAEKREQRLRKLRRRKTVMSSDGDILD